MAPLSSYVHLQKAIRFAFCLSMLTWVKCTPTSKDEAAKRVEANAQAVPSPMPPPANMLSYGTVPAPQMFWQSVQRTVGGPVGLVPSTLGGAMHTLVGLPESVSDKLDGQRPMHFAWAPEGIVVSAFFRDARKARADDGGERAVTHKTAGSVLASVSDTWSEYPGGVYLITRDGMLLWSPTSEALTNLGPYVASQLTRDDGVRATQAGLTAKLTRELLQNALPLRLQNRIRELAQSLAADAEDMEKRTGHAADFGDPRAVLRVMQDFALSRVEALKSLQGGEVLLDVFQERFEVSVVLHGQTDPWIFWNGAPAIAPETWMPEFSDANVATDAEAQNAFSIGIRRPVPTVDVQTETARQWGLTAKSVFGARMLESDVEQFRSTVMTFEQASGAWGRFSWSPKNRWLKIESEASASSEAALRSLTRLPAAAYLRGPLKLGSRAEGKTAEGDFWTTYARSGRTPALEFAWRSGALIIGPVPRAREGLLIRAGTRPDSEAVQIRRHTFASWIASFQPRNIGLLPAPAMGASLPKTFARAVLSAELRQAVEPAGLGQIEPVPGSEGVLRLDLPSELIREVVRRAL
jgi:hypothetical protein